MIVDAHYHLEERMETLEALFDQMDRYGIDRVALIPTMVDVIEPGDESVRNSALLQSALMSSPPEDGLRAYNGMLTDAGDFIKSGKIHKIYAEPDNASVANTMQTYPERFYGWIFVNPAASDPMAEIEKWAGDHGWIGVKTHPFWHRYPVAALDGVAEYCSGKGWPMLIHLGGDDERGDYRYLPERHPNLNVIYAHAGVPFYRDVWDYARSMDNVFVDLSGPSYVGDELRVETVKAVGAGKCLYGTDGPYDYPGRGRIVQAIRRMPISETDKERILGGNFLDMVSV